MTQWPSFEASSRACSVTISWSWLSDTLWKFWKVTVMLVTLWWWLIWDVGDRMIMLVTSFVMLVIFQCIKSANNTLNQSLISPFCYQHITSPTYVTNIEVTVMLVTEFRYWWHLLNVGVRLFCKKIMNVDDQNGQKRHQHIIFVTVTFCLQHPSPKFVKPNIDVTN